MKEGVVLPAEPHNHGSSDLLLSSIKQVYYRQAQGPTKPCQALSRQTALSAPILECCYTVALFHMRLQRSVLFSKVLSCLCCSYLFLTNWPGDSGQENSLLLLENRGVFSPTSKQKKKRKRSFKNFRQNMLQKITQSWKGKYSLSSPSNQPSLTQGTVVFYGQKNRFWFWSSSPSPYWWTEILLSRYYMALPEINLSLNKQFFTIFVLVWAPHAFCILSESLFFCIYVDIGLGLLRENPSTAQCFFNSAHHCNKRPT